MAYQDFVVEASETERVRSEDKLRLVRFRVRVLDSPAGEIKPEEAAEFMAAFVKTAPQFVNNTVPAQIISNWPANWPSFWNAFGTSATSKDGCDK